jgi:hypothetical protein
VSWAIAKWIVKNSAPRVQRGVVSSSSAIIVTIAPVDTSKAFVISVSKGSAGYAAARGTIPAAEISGDIAQTNVSGTITGAYAANALTNYNGYDHFAAVTRTLTLTETGAIAATSIDGTVAAAEITGGTTNLTVREYSARLLNSTQLYCDGPVEWQLIGG